MQDFIPTLAFGTCTFVFSVKIGQSRDKILYILLAFVFYPVMMLTSKPLDRLGNAGKCMISTLFPYF